MYPDFCTFSSKNGLRPEFSKLVIAAGEFSLTLTDMESYLLKFIPLAIPVPKISDSSFEGLGGMYVCLGGLFVWHLTHSMSLIVSLQDGQIQLLFIIGLKSFSILGVEHFVHLL